MFLSKMLELKETLSQAGWELVNEEEAFTVAGDEIEWHLSNSRFSGEETLTFCFFDDLGKRTNRLSDLFYVMRHRDGVRLYFDKKDNDWKRKLKEFVYTMK